MPGEILTVVKVGKRWELQRAGRFVRKLQTRKDGELLVRMYGGDLSAAPEYYRRMLKQAERIMSRRDACRYAMLDAQMLGLNPDHVQADATTGEPIGENRP